MIDNAHALPRETFVQLAKKLRVEADNRTPKGKLIVVGLPGTARRLAATQRDLMGRLDEIRMGSQPNEKIRELIEAGEQVAQLRFANRSEIEVNCAGSFQLAHTFCFESALDTTDVVPSAPCEITNPVSDVTSAVHASLGGLFANSVHQFISLGPDHLQRCAALALLWMVNQAGNGKVPAVALRKQFPELADGSAFWEKLDYNAERKADDFDPREVLQFENGAFVTEDPLLQFYLKHLNWGELAATFDIAIGWDPDTSALQILLPTEANAPPSLDESRTLYEELDYPFHRPAAKKILDYLVGAYPAVAQAEAVAQNAGVNLSQWTTHGGAIELAWRDLLRIALKQQKLPKLLSEVLTDENSKTYHQFIRDALKELGEDPPDSKK
ncbi:MAG: hypothetical protein IPK82_09690 [Polyangiaceae bacterium]|nr:hypothetical protein [Polyangiaceae bacterium]